MGIDINYGTIILEVISCDKEPSLSFNGKKFCSAKIKDSKGYSFTKCFENPVALGLHKFALTSYKGKLGLKYIAPLE